jgi:hypothetical protein
MSRASAAGITAPVAARRRRPAAFLHFVSHDNLAIGRFREFNAGNRPLCSE